MDEEQNTLTYQQSNERFISLLKELTEIKEVYAVRQLQWYRDRIPITRRLFRFSSAFLILVSVSIPFLATLEGPWKTIVLPIAALMIAGGTGISTFFRWESNWKGYTHAQMMLEHMLWVWELRITEAKHEIDPQKGSKIALHATEQLLHDIQGTITVEAEEYFKRVQAPQLNKGS
jgi:hypothetical protein